MNIALITPPLRAKNIGYRPIGLGYIKAVLKQNGYDAKIYDFTTYDISTALQFLQNKYFDIIGITVFSDTRHDAFTFAKHLKKTNSKIVLGGYHPTYLFKQIMENYDFVDFIVRGEGEITFLELIKMLANGKNDFVTIDGLVFRKNGEYFVNPPRKPIENLDDIPFPDYADIDSSKYKIFSFPYYKKNYGIITSRACAYSCEFCAQTLISRKWRARSAENTIREIEKAYYYEGIKHIWFLDSSFTENPARAIKIFHGIIKRNMKISIAMMSRANACNADVLEMFKKAGGYRIDIGIESASVKILKQMNKKINFDKVYKVREICKSLDILVKMNFIVGYPEETENTFSQTKAFARKIKPDIISISVLRIFPGTQLYDRLIKESKIDENFWLSQTCGLHYYGNSSYKMTIMRYISLLLIWATQFRIKSYFQMINIFCLFIFDRPLKNTFLLIKKLKSFTSRQNVK